MDPALVALDWSSYRGVHLSRFDCRCFNFKLQDWILMSGTYCCLLERQSLMEQCKFLWAGATLIGLHITIPFMSRLLDHRVTSHQLLSILQKLYDNLTSYSKTLCSTRLPGVPALEPLESYSTSKTDKSIWFWCCRFPSRVYWSCWPWTLGTIPQEIMFSPGLTFEKAARGTVWLWGGTRSHITKYDRGHDGWSRLQKH